MQATQQNNESLLDTRPIALNRDIPLSTLRDQRAIELQTDIDKKQIRVSTISKYAILENLLAKSQIINLYRLGFSRSGWAEDSTEQEVNEKLGVQLANDNIAITIVKYLGNIKGFFTSQILPRDAAIERVASSVINYGQDKISEYNPEATVFFLSIQKKMNKLLSQRGSLASDGADARLQPKMAVMEDLVIDDRFSSLRTLVDTIHANVKEILSRAHSEKDLNPNPYAITWTNIDNPIYKFLTILGDPHVELAREKRIIKDKDGNQREITLAVFAVNLKDIEAKTADPTKTKRILLEGRLRNDKLGLVEGAAKGLHKKANRLQKELTGSILNYMRSFGQDFEQ